MSDPGGAPSTGPAAVRFPRWRLAAGALVAVALLAAPFWGPRGLSTLAFFRVRKVEVLGLRYTPPGELLARLRVDTTRSVWDPLAPLAARVATHPQVERVVVTRRLPGTLVVDVTERRPVALVALGTTLRAVDERGVTLPLDPSRTPVDAPIVTAAPRETAVYHLLGAMQREAPRLYARVSSIRSAGGGELLLQLADLPVRTMTTVTLARLGDIEPVERDLARRRLRAAELDLRYKDQVIARLP
ncbi:MAG TPA: FtsQ-type POTRA domain-containing protein [Gemmatimonadaceae bacterium]|nr:FtsQ-type POTRA domain-containing protein [Gemmatimonadaceae bacterium]